MRRKLFVLPCLLAGCGSIAPGAALWLNTVDPLSADPGGIAVALDLPDGLGVLPGTVKLSLSATHEEWGNVQGTWALDLSRDPDERWVFRLADADREAVRRVQAQASAWENADPKRTNGSLSVGLGGCRTVPAEDLIDARASVFISLAPNSPPRAIFRNAPISRVLDDDQISALPQCP